MAISLGSPVPYAPASAILTIIGKFRGTGMPTPITADVLLRAGISESLVPRTLQALQILELITPEGQPTDTLKSFRTAPEKDYQATLASWVTTVYAEVFQFVDPAKEDVQDAFRSYEPQGQIPRMIALFQGLCVAAGIIEGRIPDSKPRARTSPSKPAPAAKQRRVGSVNEEPPPPPPPPPPPKPQETGLHPALAGILTSIPKTGGWSGSERDAFLATFTAILNFVVPVT